MYFLSHDGKRKYRYAWRDDSFQDYAHCLCPACGRTISRANYDTGPHRLVLEGGNLCPDLLAFTGAGGPMFLLSRRAIETLEQAKLAGISRTEPVRIMLEGGSPVPEAPDYFLAEVSGRIGLNMAAMGLKKKLHCHECGQFKWNRQRIASVVPDMNTWDGSDICRVEDIPGYLVCSRRFADVVKKAGLTGFCLQQLLVDAP